MTCVAEGLWHVRLCKSEEANNNLVALCSLLGNAPFSMARKIVMRQDSTKLIHRRETMAKDKIYQVK